MDLTERPFIAIWETTQACDLACQHCRARARPERDDAEFGTDEGKRLLCELRAAHVPLVVLTGGDPAKRPDLVELIRYGTDIGLHMALTPSATPLVTTSLLESLAGAGLKRLAVSIDGPTAAVHDAFRGVGGSFDEALRILETARAVGISRQVNTTVHPNSAATLARIADVVASTGAALWSVFFVVPTGRATADMIARADEAEILLQQLADIAETASFAVKTTAAPHYRRILLERQKRRRTAAAASADGHSKLRINDGRGFVFVSHRGQIFPSGFLPIACGNVRDSNVIDVYRSHWLFRALRDPELLEGKCGVCEYRAICGGSRARAHAMTGNVLGSDPLCAYVPAGYDASSWNPPRRHLSVLHG